MSEITYDYTDLHRQYRPQGGVLGTTAFLAMVVCVINCALPEIEILLTGGRCPLPIAAIKIACFGLLILLTLAYGKLDLSAFPTGIWVVMIAFLIFDFPFLWLSQNKAPIDILLSYNASYCPLIFAPLGCAFTGRLSQKSATRILVSIFLACAAIGWAQVAFQKPIMKLESTDGNFRIYASWWIAEGDTSVDRTIRACGPFGTALEYGSFAVLIAAIGIGMCGRPKGWIIGVPLYLFAAACCYSSLTRTAYLQFVFATIAAVTFTFGRSPRRMTWQPLIGLVAALVIAYGGVSEKASNKRSLTDTSSLELRVLQWETFGAEFLHSTLPQQLFGLGYSQAAKPLIIPSDDMNIGKAFTVLIDNMYLALTLHIGLIGMVIVVALLWAMWRHLRIETIKRPTPLLIGITSFWSVFLLNNMFNVSPATYGFWFLIAMMILQRDQSPAEPEWDQALEPVAAQ